MESFATAYPVFFADGDQEVDKGKIGIHSVLNFKRFQAQLSRLIGIPANQLSAVFVCRRTNEKRQKLPISENTNFNIILNQHNPSKEKGAYFLVSVKKSKKERKVARRRNTEMETNDDDDSTSSRGDTSPARKESEDVGFEAGSPSSVLDQPSSDPDTPSKEENVEHNTEQDPPVTRIGGQVLSGNSTENPRLGVIGSGKTQSEQPVFNYPAPEARFKDAVQIMGRPQRIPGFPDPNVRILSGKRVAPTSFQPFQESQRYFNFQPRLGRSDRGVEQYCQDCISYKERNIRPPPFHCCINDRITTGFRGPSPAGPIERPIKRQVKAAA